MNVTETDAEYLERDRLWHQNKRESDPTLREREAEYSRAYYQTNRDTVLERSKEYHKNRRIEHPEMYENLFYDPEIRKRYVANHKDQIDAYKKTKNVCECGGKFLTHHKSRHIQSIKHQKFLENK
jgi:hypothetical protein